MSPPLTCEFCGQKAATKCAGCGKAWYCTKKCQKDHWIEHLLKCDLKREVTTADHLALAVHKNLIPADDQTMVDYGFRRALEVEKQSHLLGVYVGLIKALGIKPRTIHEWRVGGRLAEEIHNAYAGTSELNKALYYNWFSQNTWILDGEHQTQDDINEILLRPAWDYVHRGAVPYPTSITRVISGWPKHKTMCFHMAAMSLNRMHPSPLDNMWVHFGFCTCNEDSELDLGGLYYRLLQDVAFEQFYEAFRTSKLVHLFRSNGYEKELEQYPFLVEVLTQSPTCASVWDLKQLVVAHSLGANVLLPSVALDYGLINCRTREDEQILKEAYLMFFKKPDGDALALHRACLQGEVYSYISSVVKLKSKNKKALEKLMKTPRNRR